MFFLAHKTLHESAYVLSPEPLRFVRIWLGFLLFRNLYITGATKCYHFDLTLGFSHSSRLLRSTYLGCSFNFCLLYVTAIFGGSSAKICCILVAGLKPAPWMFSQCCACCQIVFILICWYLQELIDQWLWKLELGFQIVQSAFHTIAQKTLDVQGITNFAARHEHLLR